MQRLHVKIVVFSLLLFGNFAVADELAAVREWSSSWQDYLCSHLKWDSEKPLFNPVSGSWDSGRLIENYSVRWPDCYVVDLGLTVSRQPFGNVTSKEDKAAIERLESVNQRRIRQPNGAELFVLTQAHIRSAQPLGIGASLQERPDSFLEQVPPVLARWLGTRVDSSGSIISIVHTGSDFVGELPELSVEFGLHKDAITGQWYLSSLKRLSPNGTAWWSCTYEIPKSFGESRHVIGTVRRIKVKSEASRAGNLELPASPEDRVDYLLQASFDQSCSDDAFRQNLEGFQVVQRPQGDNSKALVVDSRRVAGNSGEPSGISSGPANAKRGSGAVHSAGSWTWWVTSLGFGLVLAGVLIGLRRKS